MSRITFLLIVATACTESQSERASQVAERRKGFDSLLATEVVKGLAIPAVPGRLLYDRPADLSYDSLKVKRPELVRAEKQR
jgi:hypothetical protein